MKILIINPISHVAQKSARYYRSVSPLPPLGLAYLAAIARDGGFEVSIEDQYATRRSNQDIARMIVDEDFDVVGISCLTAVMGNVISLVSQIRSAKRSCTCILGNIHPTLFADELLKDDVADIVVRGEGEESFLEALTALRDDRMLNEIEGISYRYAGGVYHNKGRGCIADLDQLPVPAWDLCQLRYYRRYPMLGIYNKLVLPIQASRGCPYRCTFCSQDKMYDTFRCRNIYKVIDEIEYLYERFGIEYVGFTDAYFPVSIESGLAFCDEFIKRKLHKKIRWFTETRVDKVNLDLLRRMKEANLYLIMYGFEVGNQRILDSVNKCATLEQGYQAMEYTRKAGVLSLGLFVLGLPQEDASTCEETIRFAKKVNPDIVKFNIATPFPGSKFYEDQWEPAKGEDDPDRYTSWYDWSDTEGEILYSPEKMTKPELSALQRKAMASFYLRPWFIVRTLWRRTFSLADMVYGGYFLMNDYVKLWSLKVRNTIGKWTNHYKETATRPKEAGHPG
ncbi:MAG: cobalamin-dependent protein [Candidatus Omnitrophica bacterium]|nr:cobalamin-dependent protein [Candidatus Omnitrophota bacterium]